MKIDSKEKLIDLLKTEVGPMVSEIVEGQIKQQEERILAGLPHPVELAKKENERKSLVAGQLIKFMARSQGKVGHAIDLAREEFGKGASEVEKALGTITGGSGGYLVMPAMGEYIEALSAGAAVRSLNARVIPMPNGQISLPGADTGPTANWVGENQTAPSSQPGERQVNMAAKKLMVVVPTSNELLEDASGLADEWIESESKRVAEEAEDLAFVRGTGSANSPRGLRYRVDASNLFNITHAAAAATAEEVYRDLGRTIEKLANYNVKMVRAGWIFSKRTEWFLRTLLNSFATPMLPSMDRGLLFGFPFASTTQIPNNLSVVGSGDESEVYFADFQTCVIGETRGTEIKVIDGAAYYDTATTAVVSGVSNDQTVVVLRKRVDFTSLYDGKDIAVLNAVDWGA